MPCRPQNARPNFSRQRSNSVPTFSMVQVSAEEAGLLCSTAERAAARRKRPVSLDTPAPVIRRSCNPDDMSKKNFNFSTPSRRPVGQTTLRAVQKIDFKTLPALPAPSPVIEEEDVRPTPRASTAASLVSPPEIQVTSSPSPLTSPRATSNPVLRAYADSVFKFTQTRLNTAAPQTLKALGLRRDPSMPSTPELDANELPRCRPQRPIFRSNFSDWSSCAASVYEASSPPTPNEPQTPGLDTGLMTPDSFFAEVTPRVAQTAAWAAMTYGRPSSGIDQAPYTESPGRPRADSVTSTEDFSYFAGFDSATPAAESVHIAQQDRRQNPPAWRVATHASPALSTQDPFSFGQPHSPYGESLGRTQSWQVRAAV